MSVQAQWECQPKRERERESPASASQRERVLPMILLVAHVTPYPDSVPKCNGALTVSSLLRCLSRSGVQPQIENSHLASQIFIESKSIQLQ